MEIFILWLVLAVGVACIADARGRSGTAWFFLSAILSPLIGIIFLIAMPNLKQEAALERIASGTNHQKLLQEVAMEPDGALNGVPYRVADDGSIYAIMQGAPVKFTSLERFRAAVG